MSAPHHTWTAQRVPRAHESLPRQGEREARVSERMTRVTRRPAKADLRPADSATARLQRMLDDLQREVMTLPAESERARHLADAIDDLHVVIARGDGPTVKHGT